MPFPYSSLAWRLGDRLGGGRHSFLPSFSPLSLPPTVPLCQAFSSLWGFSAEEESLGGHPPRVVKAPTNPNMVRQRKCVLSGAE